MYILHGTWLPDTSPGFMNRGAFRVWVEGSEPELKPQRGSHPFHLAGEALQGFFTDILPLGRSAQQSLDVSSEAIFLLLPTMGKKPVFSTDLLDYLGEPVPEPGECSFRLWKMDALGVNDPLLFLKEVGFLAGYFRERVLPGSDLLFWVRYAAELRELIRKDQYIPALICAGGASGRKRKFLAGWQFFSSRYNRTLHQYAEAMPRVCAAAHQRRGKEPALHQQKSLLAHFSECCLADLAGRTSFPQTILKQVRGTFLAGCLESSGVEDTNLPGNSGTPETWRQWITWKNKLDHREEASSFILCFRLESAPPGEPDDWKLRFLAESLRDPSLKLELADYWEGAGESGVYDFLGVNFRRDLLLSLGYAGRIYPKIWEGLSGEEPAWVQLNLEEAFDFLKEAAWILEDAGYRVVVPAWYTPQGRRRLKVRVNASAEASGRSASAGGGYFSGGGLLKYDYEVALGDKALTEKEWLRLVKAKTPLIHFRGEWIELDREKMATMLEFWRKDRLKQEELSLPELLKKTATEDNFEYKFTGELGELMAGLQAGSRMSLLGKIPGFRGNLRAYQQRGTSWLHFLESLGLNPCLADDMGLGKTVEVIALLAYEAHNQPEAGSTLLIVPTSVLGNWQKELQRFAPGLRVLLHHGPAREKIKKNFLVAAQEYRVVITSFALALKDHKLLQEVSWRRVVVDEAQNIKNPHSSRTRAISRLKAAHRIALTGTPVENRLLDLWSLFNFLNPGYLDTAARFRKNYELPIGRDNDTQKAQVLKRLVAPFILRRVKTDKTIIRDLPEKVEQKIYCHLSREQASLYQALVDDTATTIEKKEGMERRGLILATLMKLKQICNHPSQFLQDGSGFSRERSHKLSRLAEMVEEAVESGDSLLIFTQFTEAGQSLADFFRRECHLPVSYLHGGTSAKRREAMIDEFQEPGGSPGIFILSLKAGGVGITLTRANHVFHFDRWWNPAVENQATDRAFRIGQEKNVFVHKFIAIGTLEERIDQMLEDKQKLSDMIVSGDESWLTELDNTAFLNLIKLGGSIKGGATDA